MMGVKFPVLPRCFERHFFLLQIKWDKEKIKSPFETLFNSAASSPALCSLHLFSMQGFLLNGPLFLKRMVPEPTVHVPQSRVSRDPAV